MSAVDNELVDLRSRLDRANKGESAVALLEEFKSASPNVVGSVTGGDDLMGITTEQVARMRLVSLVAEREAPGYRFDL